MKTTDLSASAASRSNSVVSKAVSKRNAHMNISKQVCSSVSIGVVSHTHMEDLNPLSLAIRTVSAVLFRIMLSESRCDVVYGLEFVDVPGWKFIKIWPRSSCGVVAWGYGTSPVAPSTIRRRNNSEKVTGANDHQPQNCILSKHLQRSNRVILQTPIKQKDIQFAHKRSSQNAS